MWDWLSSDNGQKPSSGNVNKNFDDFFADFESHFANPLSENDTDGVNKFPCNDFNVKTDVFGPFDVDFGASDNNANLWTHIENQGQNCIVKEDALSNSSFDRFDDAVFDSQSSNTESQAINNSSVPVTNVESVLSDNINNSNDQQVPNKDMTTEYSQNTNKEEM